ncbi:AAA family ATPase [Rothia nasimurium]|uniref:AAA family ATPase n=1 Tax=Rothia nasimurium TaxID=85336 RepID=UPI001F02A191|nr:AAA family ATPase [Rothia nasimurium]
MRFILSESIPKFPQNNTCYLVPNSWNDWWKYKTRFTLHYSDEKGNLTNFGYLKIGKKGLSPGSEDNYPDLEIPDIFESLSGDYFSIGLDVSYYHQLNSLGKTFREDVLFALNDLAYKYELMINDVKNETIAKESVLRDIPLNLIKKTFSEIARGNAESREYDFIFPIVKIPSKYEDKNTGGRFNEIRCKVDPQSPLPTNIHVLIGRNGVGKSNALKQITKLLVSMPEYGATNVVSVSFSAFDKFEPLEVDSNLEVKYHFIGLQKPEEDYDTCRVSYTNTYMKNELAEEFVDALNDCLQGPKSVRFFKALEDLQNDAIFEYLDLLGEFNNNREKSNLSDQDRDVLKRAFENLSSGHQIVLLNITKLVSLVQEESIVLIDEPESHLHPPLLSAFINSLASLLKQQNGMCIIATHSPVILQEVPRSCVNKIIRHKFDTDIMTPRIETYGENLGVLTKEVFELEVKMTGFHKRMLELSQEFETFDEAFYYLEGQLGEEGRSILHNLFYQKNNKNSPPWEASNVEN